MEALLFSFATAMPAAATAELKRGVTDDVLSIKVGRRRAGGRACERGRRRNRWELTRWARRWPALTDRRTSLSLSPCPSRSSKDRGWRCRPERESAYALVQCQDSSAAAATTAGVKNGRKGRWQRSQFVISPHSRTRHEKEGRKKSSRKEGT